MQTASWQRPRPLQTGCPGHTITISWSISTVISTEKMLTTSTVALNVWIASSTVTSSDWAMFHRQNSTKFDTTLLITPAGLSLSYAHVYMQSLLHSMLNVLRRDGYDDQKITRSTHDRVAIECSLLRCVCSQVNQHRGQIKSAFHLSGIGKSSNGLLGSRVDRYLRYLA